jgi:hypothetical protein
LPGRGTALSKVRSSRQHFGTSSENSAIEQMTLIKRLFVNCANIKNSRIAENAYGKASSDGHEFIATVRA